MLIKIVVIQQISSFVFFAIVTKTNFTSKKMDYGFDLKVLFIV
jgi:hypothetical protein